MSEMFENRAPITPAEIGCAATEQPFHEALRRYYEAAATLRMEKGAHPVEAGTLAICDIAGMCGLDLMTLLISFGIAHNFPPNQNQIMDVFDSLQKKVRERVLECLPEIIAGATEAAQVINKSSSETAN